MGRCGKWFGFLPYRKLLRFPRPEDKANIFISLLLKKVSYISGNGKLSFQEVKSLISIYQAKNSYTMGYKVTDEAVSNVAIPIAFVRVNTFCKAQSTFKAPNKTLIALVISANSGSFCDVYEGLS